MALVTMGGLASSTLFTLFVIPVLYAVFTRVNSPKESGEEVPGERNTESVG
ncbi:MAG: efflux RND transporter permease subunit [Firmicutes bacterium]|nr:efflux RND transporter permease subunit [Candidatus Fermentithermobacillaceae bacterium]